MFPTQNYLEHHKSAESTNQNVAVYFQTAGVTSGVTEVVITTSGAFFDVQDFIPLLGFVGFISVPRPATHITRVVASPDEIGQSSKS